MALYTPQLTKQIIDPQYHSNLRTECRLDNDRLYTSRLRLVNLSCNVDGTASANNVDYALNAGVFALIKNAFLYSGSQVIDQLLDCNRYMAFKQFNRTNEDQLCYRPLYNSKTAFYYGQDSSDGAGRTNTNEIRLDNKSSNLPSENAGLSPSSWINLRDIFPVLKNMNFISTTLMPNLRVVLEYDFKREVMTGAQGALLSIQEPVLVAEYIDNPETKAQFEKTFKPVVWNGVENDAGFLPQNQATQNFKFNGFNNKIITKMLIQKQPSELLLTPSFKTLGSQAQPEEEFDVRLNGSSVHNQPIKTHAEMLGMLTDAYGECVNFPSYSSMSLFDSNSAAATPDQLRDPTLATHNAYFGLTMPQERVQDLQVSYKRNTATNDDKNKQPLKFNVFAEVPKSLSINPKTNSVVVSYL